MDDPSEYVDVLLSDPKRKRKAMRALKERRVEHEATACRLTPNPKRSGETSDSAEPAVSATDTVLDELSERQALRDTAAELERKRLFRAHRGAGDSGRTRRTRRYWSGHGRRYGRVGGGLARENADHPRAKLSCIDRHTVCQRFTIPFAGGGALPLEAQTVGTGISRERSEPGGGPDKQGDDRDTAQVCGEGAGEPGSAREGGGAGKLVAGKA